MTFIILMNCGNLTIIENEPAPEPHRSQNQLHRQQPFQRPDDEPIPNTPRGRFSCEELRSLQLSRRRFRLTASTEGSRYTVNRYTFDYGDGTTQSYSSSRTSYTRTKYYSRPDTYTITVRIQAEVSDGSGGTVISNARCETEVIIESLPEPEPATPEDECPYLDVINLRRPVRCLSTDSWRTEQ